MLILSTLCRHTSSKLDIILFIEVRAKDLKLNWLGPHLSSDTINSGNGAKLGNGAALCLLPFKSQGFTYPEGHSVAVQSFPCPEDIQYLGFFR